MKLRKFGSLVGLLSLTLVVPACGDDDGAETTDGTDETNEEDGGDSDSSDEPTTDDEDASATTTNDDSTESDTTEDSSTDDTNATTDEEPDAGEGDASEVTTDEETDAGDVSDESPDADTTSEDAGDDLPPPPECNPGDDDFVFAPAEIDEDTTWGCDKVYVLGENQITVVTNATLTIEPGTKIIGQGGSGLVITNTAKIDANGQANAPIVFTSSKAEGEREMGDWGGIVLLGNAPINAEGGLNEAEGVPTTAGYAEYGGGDASHDCGSMSYVRIEFSGYMVSPDNELNALGAAGCGSDTELHHLQAHRGSDDGFEFWGGSPQVHHLVMSNMDDDSLDWAEGFSSSVQFVMIHAPGDTGIEADNNEFTYAAEPRTLPEISNMSLVGGRNIGVLLRRGSWGKFYNSIIADNALLAVDVRDPESVAGTTDGSLTIQNSIIFGNGDSTQFGDVDEDDFDEAGYFGDEEYNNLLDVDPNLTDVTSVTAPNYVPVDDTVLDGAIAPPAGMYDTEATYIGAFEPGGDDWTAGWTAYPEN